MVDDINMSATKDLEAKTVSDTLTDGELNKKIAFRVNQLSGLFQEKKDSPVEIREFFKQASQATINEETPVIAKSERFEKLEKLADDFQAVKEKEPTEKKVPEPSKKKEDGIDAVVEDIVNKEVNKEIERDLITKVRETLKKLQPKQRVDREVSDEEIGEAVRKVLQKKLSPDIPVSSALHQIVNKTLQQIEEPEQAIDLGQGYSTIASGKVAGNLVAQLLDRNKPTGLFALHHTSASIKDEEAVSYYKNKFSLASTEPQKTETESANQLKENTTVQGKLVIRYVPEATLEKSMFIARKGNLEVRQSAAQLLSEGMRKVILAKEAAGKVELGADDFDMTKGKVDVKIEEGKEKSQPSEVTKNLGGVDTKIGLEKEITKGKVDKKIEEGKEPVQPSQVVSKYASLINGKVVATKEAKDGSVEVTIEGGSVVRLAQLWGTKATLVKEAMIAGSIDGLARETPAPLAENPRDLEGTLARETPAPVDGAKAAGSRGAEQVRYYGQLNKGTLTEDGDGWARKVASLQGKVTELSTENKVLKASLEKTKKQAEDEKRTSLVGEIMKRLADSGALTPDQGEVLELKDQGLDHDDAVVKATANAHDKQRRELSSLDIQALEKLRDTIQKFANTRTAEPESLKALDLPIPGRDETSETLEDKLAGSW